MQTNNCGHNCTAGKGKIVADYLFEEIADQVVEQINSGAFAVGDKLPSERVMAERFGVSRNVIREAIRGLEEKGFVQVQAGRGAYICKPDSRKLSQNLSDVVRSSEASPKEILDAREVFETAIAATAAARACPATIEPLRLLLQQMEKADVSPTQFAVLDQEFHLAMARCAQNPVLTLLADSIYQMASDSLFLLTPHDAGCIATSLQEHCEMLAALEQHDVARVQEALHRHIQCLREQLDGKA